MASRAAARRASRACRASPGDRRPGPVPSGPWSAPGRREGGPSASSRIGAARASSPAYHAASPAADSRRCGGRGPPSAGRPARRPTPRPRTRPRSVARRPTASSSAAAAASGPRAAALRCHARRSPVGVVEGGGDEGVEPPSFHRGDGGVDGGADQCVGERDSVGARRDEPKSGRPVQGREVETFAPAHLGDDPQVTSRHGGKRQHAQVSWGQRCGPASEGLGDHRRDRHRTSPGRRASPSGSRASAPMASELPPLSATMRCVWSLVSSWAAAERATAEPGGGRTPTR